MSRLEPIAVIGMATRLPKARTVDAFWELLRDGVEVIEKIPDSMIDSRRDSRGRLPPEFVPMGTYLEDTEYFDCALFGLGQREAKIMDPQQRLFIEQAWVAAEDAGYDISTLGGKVAVYAGAGPSRHPLDALEVFGHDSATMFEVIATGIDKPMAMRVSHLFDLRGESVYVYAACATSLVAIDMAINALRERRADAAIAGASVLYLPQQEGYDYAEGAVRSSDGHCRAFDARADGTVWGSGVGVFVLKRLTDAVRDRDRIRALLIGSAVNNDGSAKASFAAPSRDGQMDVVRTAMQAADVQPSDIDFVEAHGTGTQIGDPIEVEALNAAFGSARGPRTCFLGSVKTNVGHLDPAAGIVGLTKTILALENDAIPATLHFQKSNPAIDFDAGPFMVNQQLEAWPRGPRTRRAGVNSFGVGGTNAHVVVEEAPQPRHRSASPRSAHLVTLSARTTTALARMQAELAEHLDRNPALELRDIAFTRNAGRRPLKARATFTMRDLSELKTALLSSAPVSMARDDAPRIAFVFPGQGSQAVDMTADVYAAESVYRDVFDECADILQSLIGQDIRQLVFPDIGVEAAAAERLRRTDIQQPILFVVSLGLAKLFRHWGVEPSTMIGHSVGEFVAATLCGTMTPAVALRVLVERGRAMQACPPGSMLACAASAASIEGDLPPDIDVAAINTTHDCVVAGPESSVALFEERMRAHNIRTTRLATSHAFHSRMVEPARRTLQAVIADLSLSSPKTPWISTVTGQRIAAEQATEPAFWAGQVTSPVRFAEAVRTALDDGINCFLELGGRPVLGSLIAEQAFDAGHCETVIVAATPSRGASGDGDKTYLEAVGQLWRYGAKVNWRRFHAEDEARRIGLPHYPFEGVWVALTQSGAAPAVNIATEKKPLAVLPSFHAAAPNADRRPRPADYTQPFVEPDGRLETEFAEIFGRVLGVSPIGANDSLFELGGNSIMLVHVANQIRAVFEKNVPIRLIVANPTPRTLGSQLRTEPGWEEVG